MQLAIHFGAMSGGDLIQIFRLHYTLTTSHRNIAAPRMRAERKVGITLTAPEAALMSGLVLSLRIVVVRQSKVKRGAKPELAFERYLAAVRLDERLDDSQT